MNMELIQKSRFLFNRIRLGFAWMKKHNEKYCTTVSEEIRNQELSNKQGNSYRPVS